MKKLLSLILGLSALSLSAQVQVTTSSPKSPRMILMEEFTNASCGPCAAANPAFNTLLNANADKVVALKYQTVWPGTDPMNAQNQTEVATRVTYYGVTGVPNAEEDGNAQNIHPASITQAMITTEAAVSAPFTMVLTHTMSTNFDSIFIKCVFTCTEAITMTTPVCHVAITEQQIHFASAPGSNGETDFYEVMRKMLPSDQGTTIATAWTVGQKDSVTFAYLLPSYIYDKNQVAVVSWIQDNSNKNVKQAAYSAPIPVPLDAAMTGITGVPVLQCTTTITPQVAWKNNGSDTVTTCKIKYRIDNAAPDSIIWNGSLAFGGTASVTLPTLTSVAGSHKFWAYIYKVNNTVDMNQKNDTLYSNFNIVGTYNAIPLSEGFQGTAFPPTNFIINNPDNDQYTWSKATTGGWGASTASARLLFYDIPAGLYDELILSPLNFSSASTLGMTFDVAHALYSTSYADKLEVFISTDCGATWTSLYNKSGATLATGTTTTSSFVPTATQWRNEYISLTPYIGQSAVLIKFKGTSDYGNNLYIDNINVAVDAAVENQDGAAEIHVYPNPAANVVNVRNAVNADVMLYDMFGKLVMTDSKIGGNYSFDVSNVAVGSYILKVINKDKASSFKVNVVR